MWEAKCKNTFKKGPMYGLQHSRDEFETMSSRGKFVVHMVYIITLEHSIYDRAKVLKTMECL